MSNKLIRTYSELIRLETFEERYRYLRLGGLVGSSTFGHDRYLNQSLYRSPEWKRFRREIIIRDEGCDLAMDGYSIISGIVVHHLTPLTIEDVEELSSAVFDPEKAVCVSHRTHEAIHFGDETLLPKLPIERVPGDTCPWR